MSKKIKVSLLCATCGQGDFNYNEDKTWVKCNNCSREYPGGISELAEYNQQAIQDSVSEFGQNLVDDFTKKMESKFKNNKHIKFKRR